MSNDVYPTPVCPGDMALSDYLYDILKNLRERILTTRFDEHVPALAKAATEVCNLLYTLEEIGE